MLVRRQPENLSEGLSDDPPAAAFLFPVVRPSFDGEERLRTHIGSLLGFGKDTSSDALNNVQRALLAPQVTERNDLSRDPPAEPCERNGKNRLHLGRRRLRLCGWG